MLDSGCIRMDGKRIAVAVGSRGICNLPEIVRTVVDYLKDMGASPFIVPSIGIHVGATAEGQKRVLRSLNITGYTMNCPILSSMETVCVGRNEEGREVLVDKNAA